jgi:outer membrane receptor protein involved in Fe transport
MYETNRRWVYTHTDRTKNELNQFIFNFQRLLDESTELALNAYLRNSSRRTAGGDAEREDDVGIYDNEAVLNSTTTRQTSYGASTNLTKLLDRHQLTIGGAVDASDSSYGATQQGCELESDRSVADCAGAVSDEAKVKGNTLALALFGSDTMKIAEGTHLTAAARFNHTRVDNTLTSYYMLSGNDAVRRDSLGYDPETQRERFNYNSLNPSLGISHQIAPAITVFSSVGRSNRVPTTIELGCASLANPCRLPTGLQADPYLNQVIAQTIELGARWRFASDSEMTVAAYRSDNTNDILFHNVDQTGLGYFKNFSKTRRQGIDIGMRTVIENVTLSGNYSYLDATYQDTAELFGGVREIEITPGKKIAGLPDHTIKINVDWRAIPKLVLGGTLMGTSRITTQGNEDGQIGSENGAQTLDVSVKGYTLLHLHANYEADKGLDYFARVNNVFDTRFESYGLMAMTMFNPNGLPIDPIASATGPNVSRFVAPGAPRNFMVGLRYRF